MEPNAGTAWSVLGLSKVPDRRSDSHDDGPRRQPASFLFVNYQAQTSQGSTVSKKKHAFIKTMYHRSKKEQRLQKLKASIGPLPTQRSNPSILPSTPGSTTFPIGAEARVEEYEACSFDRALRPAGIDPFASLCVPAKSSVDFYFDHYRTECSWSIYPFGATGVSIWWWQQSIEQPALLYIILATSASHRAGRGLIAQAPKAAQDSHRASLEYRQKTITGLQSMMKIPGTSLLRSMAVIIAHLICVEAADTNLEAVDGHVRGLIKIVHLVGGLDTFIEEAPVLNDWLVYTAQQLLLIAPDCVFSDLQECLRLSVLLFAAVQVWGFQGLLFLNRPVLAFHCRLEAALLPIRRLAVDLSFWMLFTGGIAAMGHPSRAWFVDRLAEVAGQLSLATWDEARALLEQFLFFSRPTDTRAEILWKEIKRQQGMMQNS
ncbi:hypothetical protein AnigIFM63604_010531 [Aspergillus niger]|uniref:Uncharacterized protein n=1 Tax=Aspergillus niger TaxID=5061 RepID=A0A9W6A999_ASPNG|nr:hypothetical protein AnigIFM63604_010531 [Aspergillus niger]